MSELTKRVIIALLLAPLFLYVTWLGGWYFFGLIAGISLFIVYELDTMFKHKQINTNLSFLVIIAIWALTSNLYNESWLIGSLIILIFILRETLTPPHERILGMMATIFSAGYAAWGMYSFLYIRSFGEDTTGFIVTLFTILMVWGNDIFAYFGGKTMGKHKMAPEISPKKTWEGFISGFIGSILVITVGWYLTTDYLTYTYLELLPLAFLVGIFGPVGDLMASKVKRYTEVKDSGHFLPGHGGFFDRFDSLLLVSPAVAGYLTILS